MSKMSYKILGKEMQYVEIELEPKEKVIAESGSFMMMDSNIKMDTILGDGSKKNDTIFKKISSTGKRLLTSESVFMNTFSNESQDKKKVSFAAPYPGTIVPIDLSEQEGEFICQKDAFLCAENGVSLNIEFSKRFGRGFFGGEGFIMQKLEGVGMAFIHAGGTLAKKELLPDEILKVSVGYIVAFSKTVDYNIKFTGGIKNTFFGGEGLFFATLKGPGTVYIQSLSYRKLIRKLLLNIPKRISDNE